MKKFSKRTELQNYVLLSATLTDNIEKGQLIFNCYFYKKDDDFDIDKDERSFLAEILPTPLGKRKTQIFHVHKAEIDGKIRVINNLRMIETFTDS